MRRSTIANAKNQFSRLLEAVRGGESVLILDRDRPVARLEPVRGTEDGALPETLERLERAGLLRRASAPLPASLLATPRRAPARTASPGDAVLDALLEDRRVGR